MTIRMGTVERRADSDEDNRRANGEHGVQISENTKLVLFTAAVHIHLLNANDCEFVVLQRKRGGIWREFLRVFNNSNRESGTPEEDLGSRWNISEFLRAGLVFGQ